MKRFFLLLFLVPVFISAEAFYSPSWGFYIDLPEGYEYLDGDGKDRFSFIGPGDSMIDLAVFYGVYGSMLELVNDISRRIQNTGDADYFHYRDKRAAIIELKFNDNSGWGICVELGKQDGQIPMLLALAYSSSGSSDLDLLHISALDSICPTIDERNYPGIVIEYSYPRGGMKPVTLPGGVHAIIRENDAEAAQVLIEREFSILRFYADSPYWKEAWMRFYRFIYRDSFDRILNPVFALVRTWGGFDLKSDAEKRAFAQRALKFTQGFNYERNLDGSDFVNLVTAVTEGRGDCDSRAMLWAIILSNADIRSAMMVSSYYSHAMGLADIEGAGARFEHSGVRWLVAETTADIDIGLIAQEQSDSQRWIGVDFP